jgi:hypothetical protein
MATKLGKLFALLCSAGIVSFVWTMVETASKLG